MEYLEGAGKTYLDAVNSSYTSFSETFSPSNTYISSLPSKSSNMCRNTCRMFGKCSCGNS